MTIQEAIKSGKPFRREAWAHNDSVVVVPYHRKSYGGGEMRWEANRVEYKIKFIDDILADDWVVRE